MSEPLLFRQVLKQHQAMSTAGWALVFGVLAVVFTGYSLAMFLNGAWPVIGFLGLELGGLYLGFRVLTARARKTEEVIVTSSTLSIQLMGTQGQLVRQSFDAKDCSVALNTPTTWDDPVVLRAGARRIPFGAGLNPDQRRDVANQLYLALKQAKAA